MKSYPKNIIKYHLQYERQPFLLLWGMALAFYWFIHLSILSSYTLQVTLCRLLGSILSFVLLRVLCRSYIFLRWSRVGKELQRYGDMRKVAEDVNRQYQTAIYRSRDQAVTQSYLILLNDSGKDSLPVGSGEQFPVPNIRSIFRRECGLCLISTSELSGVSIEGGNPYANEMNTLLFTTMEQKKYSIIIYQEYRKVQKMKEELEQCILLRKGPVVQNSSRRSRRGRQMSSKKPEKPAIIASGQTVRSSYTGKKKVFWGVMAAIVALLAGVFVFLNKMEHYTLRGFVRDVAAFPLESAALAAVYIVPPTLIYIHIRRMERQVMRQYRRLKYYEQQALDERICREPGLRPGDVLYEPSCFWFRDWHNFLFHNLVLYEDVVWIYPAHAASDFSSGPEFYISSAMQWNAIIFYTKDGRKHSIFMGDYRRFASHVPHVVTGYGKEQKQAYKRMRRQIKKEMERDA